MGMEKMHNPATATENLLMMLLSFSLLGAARLRAELPPNEHRVMAELKGNLTFPNNTMPWSSNDSDDPCDWNPGVKCDWYGQVTKIRIPNLNLTGSLPADLGYLSHLVSLDVSGNQIGGPLPKFSAQLTQLDTLLLNDNNFTSIPPDFFSGMTLLSNVSLDNNPFSPWNLSSVALNEATNLQAFSAVNCSISGVLPDIFSGDDFTQLQHLRLSYNNLTGGLPPSLSTATSMKTLLLNNQGTGYSLGGGLDVLMTMIDLTQVWLQGNAFSGQLPADFSLLTSLQDFRVDDNLLTGPVPDTLSKKKISSLRVVYLGNNALQGPAPAVGDGVEVDDANVTNHFCTPQPGVPCDPRVNVLLDIAKDVGYPITLALSWEGNDTCAGAGADNRTWVGVTCDGEGNITALNFAGMNLSGTISSGISSLTQLQSLTMARNNLTGEIPGELTKLANLTFVDFSNNDLCGPIPAFTNTTTTNVTILTDGNDRISQDCPRPPPPSLAHTDAKFRNSPRPHPPSPPPSLPN
ncbi:hypothetical protein DM860_017850 [Cuscuta australis]|uniref:Leucine-rich repeat-containing N-terminal plant-type domain-containing protein n=1 Tax=Cuscuta australis TaxID=267555 RepID=A0A328DUH8_9ASTE|nr:hypothetical protein DM860_017850 [Cuscuta australis]